MTNPAIGAEARHRALLETLAEKDGEIERLRAEIADLRMSVIAFGGPAIGWIKR